ncbi:MAG: hypothetical protein ACFE9V_01610 [Candidatus Hodarchaeota archaeon]
MNFSRKDLVQTDATMNQMRNSIHILATFMERNGLTDLKERLRKMGKNIAKTYMKYWKPTDTVNVSNLKDVITTIYQKVLNSSPSIELSEAENIVRVRDSNCALCKYHYDEIEIAGCEIILGMVSEIISHISRESKGISSLVFKPQEVIESRAYGNKTCIQVYKYKIGRRG